MSITSFSLGEGKSYRYALDAALDGVLDDRLTILHQTPDALAHLKTTH